MLDSVETICAEVVDEMCERGEVDLVEVLSKPFPLLVSCDMMGIPRSEFDTVLDATSIILGAGDPDVLGGRDPMSAMFGAGMQLRATRTVTLSGHEFLEGDKVVLLYGVANRGITSLTLAGTDPRVRAVFVLSGSSVGPTATREQAAAVMDKVKVPVGFAVGGAEDIASAQAHQDFELLAPGIPGYVASHATGDHVTVSTDSAILAEVAEIGVNWIDYAVSGNETARQNLVENPCRDCALDVWTVRDKHLE